MPSTPQWTQTAALLAAATALAATAAAVLAPAATRRRRTRRLTSSFTTTGAADAGAAAESRRLCVATRVHQQQATKPVDLGAIRAFFERAIAYGDSVAIAVGGPAGSDIGATDHPAAAIRTVAREVEAAAGKPGVITVVAVQPWGIFVPALNALLSFAAADKADLILYQSLETAASSETVAALVKQLHPVDDLVVGAALQGHTFAPGRQPLTGLTTPWNTLAVWSVSRLARLGFLGAAEGLLEGIDGGVEEVTAIATLQLLAACQKVQQRRARREAFPFRSLGSLLRRFWSSSLFDADNAIVEAAGSFGSGCGGGGGGGGRMCAKLVKLPGVSWETAWADEGRRQWHEKKMASKATRAAAQMAVLGLPHGIVYHVLG